MNAVEQIGLGIRQQVHELAAPAGQQGGGERRPVLEVEDDELLGEGNEEYVPPARGEGEPGEVEGEN